MKQSSHLQLQFECFLLMNGNAVLTEVCMGPGGHHAHHSQMCRAAQKSWHMDAVISFRVI
jgi:hypothetical protein